MLDILTHSSRTEGERKCRPYINIYLRARCGLIETSSRYGISQQLALSLKMVLSSSLIVGNDEKVDWIVLLFGRWQGIQ